MMTNSQVALLAATITFQNTSDQTDMGAVLNRADNLKIFLDEKDQHDAVRNYTGHVD